MPKLTLHFWRNLRDDKVDELSSLLALLNHLHSLVWTVLFALFLRWDLSRYFFLLRPFFPLQLSFPHTLIWFSIFPYELRVSFGECLGEEC